MPAGGENLGFPNFGDNNTDLNHRPRIPIPNIAYPRRVVAISRMVDDTPRGCRTVDVLQTRPADVACAVLIISIAVTCFLGSCIFLTTLYRLRSRGVSSHLFMASLVLSDLLVALFSMPYAVSILFHNRSMPVSPDPTFNKYLQGFSHFIGRQASLGTMCLIVLDRFIAIRNPFRYKRLVTWRLSALCCLIVWILAVLISVWPWFERLHPCVEYDPEHKKILLPYDFVEKGLFIYASWMPTCEWTAPKYGYYVFIPTFAVTLVLVFGLSIFLSYRLWAIKITLKGREKNFRQATVTTLYVSFLFLLCYTVRHLYPVIASNQCLSCEVKGIIAAYMTSVIYVNSAANPIIYMLRGKMLKREAAALLATMGSDIMNVVSNIAEDVSVINGGAAGDRKKNRRELSELDVVRAAYRSTPRQMSCPMPQLEFEPKTLSFDLSPRLSPRRLRHSISENGVLHLPRSLSFEPLAPNNSLRTLVEIREEEHHV